MAGLFNTGPTEAEFYPEFYDRADNLPVGQRTNKSVLIRIASELGSKHPQKRADEYIRSLVQNKKLIAESQEGENIRKTLESLPQFAPQQVKPEKLTELVAATAPNLPTSQFLQSAQKQNLGNFRSPLDILGFQNLPPEISRPIALQSLSTALLPQKGYENMSGIELELAAAQGDPLANQVLESRKQRSIEVSAAQGRERVALERGLPLLPEKRSELADPDTLEPPPAGMSYNDAIQKGYVKVRAEDRQKLADFASSEVLIDSIFGLADQIITATTPFEAQKQGALLIGGALTKANPVAAAYRDSRASFAGTLSRSLAAERGVLTDRDIRRIVDAFPKFNETYQIKEYKKGLIKLLYKRTYGETKNAAVGKRGDTKKWRKELDDLINRLAAKEIGTTKEGKTIIQYPNGDKYVLDY